MIERTVPQRVWADADPLVRLILALIEDEPGIPSERIVALLRRTAAEDHVRTTLGVLEDARLIRRVFGECYPC